MSIPARFPALPPPLEDAEQRTVASWLNACPVRWFHVPNGRKRGKLVGVQLKREGVKPGVPDNWILTPPPNRPDAIGAVFEMKRRGSAYRKPSGAQKGWLDYLAGCGFITFDAAGADAAIRRLLELGYRPKIGGAR